MDRSRATPSRPGARSHARLPVLLAVALLVAEVVDLAADAAQHGGLGLGALLATGFVPQLAGLAAAGLLGLRTARRAPGASRGRRIVAATGVLLCGLLVQELASMALASGHGAHLGELAAHAVDTVVPLALGGGVAVGLLVGVGRVVRRLGRGATGPVEAFVVPTILTRLGGDTHVAVGRLLDARAAGRAPPHSATA